MQISITMNTYRICPCYLPQIKASTLEPKTKIQPKFSSKPNSSTEKIESLLPFNVKSITSTSNPFVKHCLKLRQNSSYRHSHGEVLVVGSIPISVDDECPEEECSSWFPNVHRVLVLDGIQDPGNLGTLLRSAMAFGWGGAFLLPGCCDPFNEKALRASRGASFQLPLVSGGWLHLDTLRNHYNMKMVAGHPASDQKPRRISKLTRDFTDSLSDTPLCLVLGSEGGGLSEQSKDASELVSIPMAGEFESLNVSVAGGIFLYMLQPENRISLRSV